jgi:hypothetical protein
MRRLSAIPSLHRYTHDTLPDEDFFRAGCHAKTLPQSVTCSPCFVVRSNRPAFDHRCGSRHPLDCDRACLAGIADRYFQALAARSPANLPLAPNVKLTDNGTVTSIAQSALWKSAEDARLVAQVRRRRTAASLL